MPLPYRCRSLTGLTVAAALLLSGAARREAWALDKQGAAHAGAADEGTGVSVLRLQVSGQLFLGILPYNPTYAARPDNTGHALLRAGGHTDLDLFGERLFIPIDLNLFTDRDAPSARPSEIDLIGGVASTWPVPGGKGELGVRGEWDTTGDGRATGKTNQGYVDVRGRYITSLAPHLKSVDSALAGGDVSGWLTLGWFAWNPVYYARPDNSGRALLRYAAHLDLSFCATTPVCSWMPPPSRIAAPRRCVLPSWTSPSARPLPPAIGAEWWPTNATCRSTGGGQAWCSTC